jgi:hypothetical protein
LRATPANTANAPLLSQFLTELEIITTALNKIIAIILEITKMFSPKIEIMFAITLNKNTTIKNEKQRLNFHFSGLSI